MRAVLVMVVSSAVVVVVWRWCVCCVVCGVWRRARAVGVVGGGGGVGWRVGGVAHPAARGPSPRPVQALAPPQRVVHVARPPCDCAHTKGWGAAADGLAMRLEIAAASAVSMGADATAM